MVWKLQSLALALLGVGTLASATPAQSFGDDQEAWWYFGSAGPNNSFGASLDLISDLNGDGVPDAIVGIPDRYFFSLTGQVDLVCGATGGLIRSIFGRSGQRLGQLVAAGGDLDGDGVEDILARFTGNPPGDHRSIAAFSGATGQPLSGSIPNLAGGCNP